MRIKKLIFYNHFGAGDLFESREFVKEWASNFIPDKFQYYYEVARAKGFLMVASSPLTRSSYHADDDFIKLSDARKAANN
jgi:hypothetical protein